MRISPKALKKPAWAAMRSAVPSAMLVALVYYLLGYVLPQSVSLLTPSYTLEDMFYSWDSGMWIAIFLSILLTLYILVLHFGFRSWSLRTARRQWAGPGTLLDGFGMAGRVLLMELQIALRTAGWSVPYIFLSAILLVLVGEDSFVGSIFIVFTLSAVFVAIVMAIVLRYALAPYLLWDYPDAGTSTAVRRSVEMMRGRKWQLFKLYLSFWPWYLAQILLELAVNVAAAFPLLERLAGSGIIGYGDLSYIISQLQAAAASPPAVIAGLVVNLGFALIFYPYLEISAANFYRSLSQEPVTPAFSGESF